MRIAYADPPYPKQAKKHYKHDPSGIPAAEVDHAALIAQLERDYDGWALSTGSVNLQEVLALCPPGVRIGAWVKPFAFAKPGVLPVYAWEPVLFHGGRKKRGKSRGFLPDWVSANATMRTGTHGSKPDAFSYWLFDILGMQEGDEFCDLFPGSGAVSRAWECYRGQARITTTRPRKKQQIASLWAIA